MSGKKKSRPGSRRSPPAERSPAEWSPAAEAYDEIDQSVEEEPVDVADDPPSDVDESDDDPVEPAGDEPREVEDDPGDDEEVESEDGDEVEEDDDPVEPEHPAVNGEVARANTTTRPGAADDFGDSRLLIRRPGDRGTFVPGWVMRACRNEPARMLVLAQLTYWLGRTKAGQLRARKRVPGDPYYWVLKTHRELGGEVGLSVSQVRTALAGLVATGLVESRSMTFRGRLANCLRINRKAVEWAAEFDE